MKLTADTLADIGEALFGPHWVAPLADALDVNLRTMQRWAAGQFAIPDTLRGELATLCRARGRGLERWAEKLTRQG
jgi:hypothetical protein